MTCRLKSLDSFEHKAAKPHLDDLGNPKYERPLEQIEDIVGVRVISFFPEAVEAVQNAIATRHAQIEWSDKREQLRRSERFGYQSLHGVITLTEGDCPSDELVGLKLEVQIRTILQHAWAEIEHDVQYKETQVRDAGIRRRFLLLAAQLESIDRELQSIHDDHRALRERASEGSDPGDAPIERSAVRAALEQACPGAPSASDDELDWILTQFERLGMTSMEDVWRVLGAADQQRIQTALGLGYPRGQRRQVDDALLAAFGERYVGEFGGKARVARLTWRLRELRANGLAPPGS